MTKIYFFFPKCKSFSGDNSKKLSKVYIGQTFDYIDETNNYDINFQEYGPDDANYISENGTPKTVYICLRITRTPGWRPGTTNCNETVIFYTHDLEKVLETTKKIVNESIYDEEYIIYFIDYNDREKCYSKITNIIQSVKLNLNGTSMVHFDVNLNPSENKIYREPQMSIEDYDNFCKKITAMKKEIDINNEQKKIKDIQEFNESIDIIFVKIKNLFTFNLKCKDDWTFEETEEERRTKKEEIIELLQKYGKQMTYDRHQSIFSELEAYVKFL